MSKKIFNFNKKQQVLVNQFQFGLRAHREIPELKRAERTMVCENNLPEESSVEEILIESGHHLEPFKSSIAIDNIYNIQPTDKITNNLIRDKFGFIPKQLTNVGILFKEIKPYVTKSIMVSYRLKQEKVLSVSTPTLNVRIGSKETISLDEATSAVFWFTFYDRDTKLLAYKLYPTISSKKIIASDHSQSVYSLKFTAQAAQVEVNEFHPSQASLKEINLNHVRKFKPENFNYALSLHKIPEKHFGVVCNMQTNVISSFDTGLV